MSACLSFSASGALREVTLFRAPLRRPVCPIRKGSHSSHRPDVCLHRCVQLGDPESCSPRQPDLSFIVGTLAADLCLRSPCSPTLLPGVVSSTRQVNSPPCHWLVKKHLLKLHATDLSLPCLLQGLSSSVLLDFKGVSSSALLVHSLRQCPPFNGCLLLSYSSNSQRIQFKCESQAACYGIEFDQYATGSLQCVPPLSGPGSLSQGVHGCEVPWSTMGFRSVLLKLVAPTHIQQDEHHLLTGTLDKKPARHCRDKQRPSQAPTRF